jgi:uncharacterized membrane protein
MSTGTGIGNRDASAGAPPPGGADRVLGDLSEAEAEKETGRIEALSDGVIAIAITLLIIEVGVPHVDEEHPNLFDAVWAQWPVYLAYVTSFWSIGLAWIIHHHIFRAVRRFDSTLLLLNMLLLLAIAFVPHPTAIVADYLRDDEQQGYALMIYSGTWLMLAVLLNALWWYARTRRLTVRDLDPTFANRMSQRLILGPPLYLIALVVSYFSFPAAIVVYLIIGGLYTFPEIADRLMERRARPAA